MQPFRFLLYGLCAVIGFNGLIFGGGPVPGALLQGHFNSIGSDEVLFRQTVVFLLSLMLLVLVHLGHWLAGAFRVSPPKPVAAPVPAGKPGMTP
jgi:hypothetical protein